MSETDKVFAGSIPELYDHYLGPLIFEPYAIDMARRVAEIDPRRVLETAAGTGIVTRTLARTLPAGTAIMASDLNQPMLDFAANHTSAANVTWRRADAQALPFEDASFDVVACQFGAMFFPDKPLAYREALRVLRPGGRFVLSVWDRIEANEVAHTVQDALGAVFPDDPPQFLARTPYGHHDPGTVRRDLAHAGFADIAVETVAAASRAASARGPAIGFCQGTPLRNEIEARDAARLGEATDAAAAAIARRFGEGPIEGRIRAHVFVARR